MKKQTVSLVRLCVLPALLNAVPVGAADGSVEELIVTARRVDEPLLRIPAAVSVVTGDELQIGRQQLGLDEALSRVPGLFFQNRYNFAQDLRISMRGFGARADFGIRGVKIYVDDIPATLPDGQGGVDGIDIGSIGRVEVLRGPVSALYGTAAGGVLKLATEDGVEDAYVEARAMLGSYGSAKYQLQTGGTRDRWQYYGSLSHTEVDGYRGYSQTRIASLNSKFSYQVDESLSITAVLSAVDSPLANDGGGLTLAEVNADRRQGRALNITFGAGESLTQQRAGVVVHKRIGAEHDLKLRAFGLLQDFETRIVSAGTVARSNGGWVEFGRTFYGAGGEYTYTGMLADHQNRLTIGFETAWQDDDRVRYVNNNNSRGVLTFDQNEAVATYGFFAQDAWWLTDAVGVNVGARYDFVDFDVSDHFLLNLTGDDSGQHKFEKFSPAVGLIWSPHEWFNTYANVSTSFETPTTTEFANPAGGGFNADLGAQSSVNYEVGIKGILPARLSYELAVFSIETDDELVPFQVPGDDRVFFENAGTSTRNGIESSVTAELARDWRLTGTYTWSDFDYDRFRTANGMGGQNVFDGNDIPGSPHHQFFGEIAYTHPAGAYATWDILMVSGFYADNANITRIDGYEVSNLRFGYAWEQGEWEIGPFFGINNLFNAHYNSNVRLNAAVSRYYEPAPGRHIYGGISIRRLFGS